MEIVVLYSVKRYDDGCGWVTVSDLFMDSKKAVISAYKEVREFLGEEEYQALLKVGKTAKVNGTQYMVFASYAHLDL